MGPRGQAKAAARPRGGRVLGRPLLRSRLLFSAPAAASPLAPAANDVFASRAGRGGEHIPHVECVSQTLLHVHQWDPDGEAEILIFGRPYYQQDVSKMIMNLADYHRQLRARSTRMETMKGTLGRPRVLGRGPDASRLCLGSGLTLLVLLGEGFLFARDLEERTDLLFSDFGPLAPQPERITPFVGRMGHRCDFLSLLFFQALRRLLPGRRPPSGPPTLSRRPEPSGPQTQSRRPGPSDPLAQTSRRRFSCHPGKSGRLEPSDPPAQSSRRRPNRHPRKSRRLGPSGPPAQPARRPPSGPPAQPGKPEPRASSKLRRIQIPVSEGVPRSGARERGKVQMKAPPGILFS